jgi:hypothetical protein
MSLNKRLGGQIVKQTLKKQYGMTGLGWLVVIGLILFFALLAMKLGPPYLENYSIKSALESLKTEPLITKKSPREVRELLSRRFEINYVDSVGKKDIKITRKGGIMTVEVTYEIRKHMAANIDALLTFSDQVELVSN